MSRKRSKRATPVWIISSDEFKKILLKQYHSRSSDQVELIQDSEDIWSLVYSVRLIAGNNRLKLLYEVRDRFIGLYRVRSVDSSERTNDLLKRSEIAWLGEPAEVLNRQMSDEDLDIEQRLTAMFALLEMLSKVDLGEIADKEAERAAFRRLKVKLRKPVTEDLEIIFPMTQDPLANEMAKVFPRSRASYEDHWARCQNDPETVVRTILLGNEVVGLINRFPVDGKQHVGYLIDRAYWGRGIGTRALDAFVHLGKVRPLYAHVASSNIGSRRVLEKCGFVLIDERDSPETERYMACIEAVYELR